MNRLLVSVLVVTLCAMESRTENTEFNDAALQTDQAVGQQQDFISHFSRPSTMSCKHHYRELANYLLELAREALARSAKPQMCERKRNSELINSLLGLPKVMNDAGRK